MQLSAPRPDADARVARRTANHRIAFLGHAVAWGSTVLFLAVVAGFKPAMVVACAWGIALSVHGFFGVIAPALRARWTQSAIAQQVQVTVTDERNRHARSLEVLSASIAHEIRNPLTAAKSLVAQIGEDPAAKENTEYARVALEELDRVERSITHLLRYAREQAPRFAPTPLLDVVDAATETLRERIAHSDVICTRTIDRDILVRADAEQLRGVVINLVANALDALEGTKDGVIEIEGGTSLSGKECWLRVKDNGPGIPENEIDRIFEPFRTTKAKGTGLGLPIARKVVEAHGGTLRARSQPGETEFELTLPVSS